MLNQSKINILLADHTKFDTTLMCQTTTFYNIHYIITDQEPSEEYIKLFRDSGTKLIIAN